MERERHRAKFWLDPVRLQEGGGFGPSEINRIAALVEANRESLLEAWDGFFND